MATIDSLTPAASPIVGTEAWHVNVPGTGSRKLTADQVINDLAGGRVGIGAAAPTVSDDSTQGFQIGSRWVETTTPSLYLCTDATAGAAVWTAIVGGGAATPAVSFVELTADSVATNGGTDVVPFNNETVSSADITFNTGTHRWTPTAAGYYQVAAVRTYVGGATFTDTLIQVNFNGALLYRGPRNGGDLAAQVISPPILFNGTTDYVDVQSFQQGGAGSFRGVTAGSQWTWASLTRVGS